MSKYTTQLRWIIEQNADPSATTISQKITSAIPKIFDFDFPIWDETHRATLERKILTHYFNKEIALETVGLWKFYLEERLNLIMPYYNQLYLSTQQQYDMLSDINFTESVERTQNVNETAKEDLTGNTTSNTKDDSTINSTLNQTHTTTNTVVSSDFPQAQIGITDYASEASDTKGTLTANDSSNTTENRTNDGTTDVTQNRSNNVDTNLTEGLTRTRKGNSGGRSFPQLIQEYRAAIINIDNLVLDELYDLFFLLY